jgi:hypothetical protein
VRESQVRPQHISSTRFILAAIEPSFFILEEPRPGSPQDIAHGTRALKEEGFKVGPAPRCPACGGFIGLLRWLPPFRVELETWGKEFGDVIHIGDELLVSERFVVGPREDPYEAHLDDHWGC